MADRDRVKVSHVGNWLLSTPFRLVAGVNVALYVFLWVYDALREPCEGHLALRPRVMCYNARSKESLVFSTKP